MNLTSSRNARPSVILAHAVVSSQRKGSRESISTCCRRQNSRPDHQCNTNEHPLPSLLDAEPRKCVSLGSEGTQYSNLATSKQNYRDLHGIRVHDLKCYTFKATCRNSVYISESGMREVHGDGFSELGLVFSDIWPEFCIEFSIEFRIWKCMIHSSVYIFGQCIEHSVAISGGKVRFIHMHDTNALISCMHDNAVWLLYAISICMVGHCVSASAPS